MGPTRKARRPAAARYSLLPADGTVMTLCCASFPAALPCPPPAVKYIVVVLRADDNGEGKRAPRPDAAPLPGAALPWGPSLTTRCSQPLLGVGRETSGSSCRGGWQQRMVWLRRAGPADAQSAAGGATASESSRFAQLAWRLAPPARGLKALVALM